jgi:hypothetical protein
LVTGDQTPCNGISQIDNPDVSVGQGSRLFAINLARVGATGTKRIATTQEPGTRKRQQGSGKTGANGGQGIPLQENVRHVRKAWKMFQCLAERTDQAFPFHNQRMTSGRMLAPWKWD